MPGFFNICKKQLLLVFVLGTGFLPLNTWSQDIPPIHAKRIFFPYPMDKKAQVSIGILSTTLINEVTEETRFRVPAIDLHLINRLGKKMILDTRLNSQFFQNNITVGPRYIHALTGRLSLSLGNDVGYWLGFFNQRGFKTRAWGWSNTPNLSVGYRFPGGILLTVRAESLMSFGKESFADETRIDIQDKLFNGSAYTVLLEQPFFADKGIILGFRALYTNFMWQTWALYENFERNLFYPQLIFGVIL